MQRCRECKHTLPFSEFHRNPSTKTGYNTICKACRRKYDAERLPRLVQELYEWLRQYKMGHPCIECGESDPVCLDFHHRDPSAKVAGVYDFASRGNIGPTKREVEKCDILCCNCHRKVHYRRLEGNA